jgi:hypothetical protein
MLMHAGQKAFWLFDAVTTKSDHLNPYQLMRVRLFGENRLMFENIKLHGS